MSEIANSPKPEPKRIQGGPSGDHLTPEGARWNKTGSDRGQYPKGSEPKPGQSVAPGPSGDSQDGSFGKGKRVPPVATRKGGERKNTGSVSNPFSSRDGKFGTSSSKKNPL